MSQSLFFGVIRHSAGVDAPAQHGVRLLLAMMQTEFANSISVIIS